MKYIKYSKAPLVFARKENKEYLIYSAKNRGIHLVSLNVYKVWKACSFVSISKICSITKFSLTEVRKIISLLKKRDLISKK